MGLDHFSLSRLTDGTPHSSSNLLYFTLLLPFNLDKIFQVQLPFSLLLFWTKILKFSKSHSCSLFSSDKNFLSPTSVLQKHSTTIPNSVLTTKSFQSRKNILGLIFFWLRKFPTFSLTHFKLLPQECKHCPLTLVSVLVCDDSVDELRLWNKSESFFAHFFICSILLPL